MKLVYAKGACSLSVHILLALTLASATVHAQNVDACKGDVSCQLNEQEKRKDVLRKKEIQLEEAQLQESRTRNQMLQDQMNMQMQRESQNQQQGQ